MTIPDSVFENVILRSLRGGPGERMLDGRVVPVGIGHAEAEFTGGATGGGITVPLVPHEDIGRALAEGFSAVGVRYRVTIRIERMDGAKP